MNIINEANKLLAKELLGIGNGIDVKKTSITVMVHKLNQRKRLCQLL